MTTTPPPSSAIRTPPTPRHGPRYDSYEPYSPRRSKRIAGQQHLFSDSPTALDASTSDLLKEHNLRRDQKSHQTGMSDRPVFSPPQSQHNSPKRKSERQMNSRSSLSPQPKSRVRHDTGSSSLPPSYSTMDANSNNNHPAMNGMLPTPVKTPRKKKVEDLGPAARTLFSSNSKSEDPEAMVPKRSRSKKYTGFSLESFETDPQQAGKSATSQSTDSRDRVPQVNDSMDNPFRSKSAEPAPSTSKPSSDGTKRRKLDDSSQKRDKNVDKAIRRDDGLLYVFRGKKKFHKFEPEAEEDEGDDDDLGLLASRSELTNESMPRIRPLTRSSIKPRVLFPEATATPARDEEEPTTPSTIVEVEEEEQVEVINRPVAAVASTEAGTTNDPITPQGQMINPETPSSPLATGRSLRSHGMRADSEPGFEHRDSEAPVAKRFSPFDRWWRAKSHATPTKAKKRGIEGQSGPHAKKSRSH
ncbi:hypothetical protein FQN49_004054 [Arthroderma sp. PD_2]|nr:hypothetical protein FQN49_004054 [Arthroderma sp. PD_2]